MSSTDYDYIIIGSGIAGLNTALLAREHGSVLIITKGAVDDCNTRYAQGGIAAAIGPGDSPSLHLRDTLAAGAGLCDPDAVDVLTREGPQRVANLIQWGVPFDTSEGTVMLGREGAHSMPRILHAGGDATGQHIELTLSGLVAESNITVLEFTLATRLGLENGRVRVVETLDSGTGQRQEFTANFVVVATGGAGQIYRYTTNPEVATGDGVALAYLAGARVMDMEFYQFHPTALWLEGRAHLPAIRGHARRRGGAAGLSRRRVHGRVSSSGRSGPAGRGVPGHCRRDGEIRRRDHLSGHFSSARGRRPEPGFPPFTSFAWTTVWT